MTLTIDFANPAHIAVLLVIYLVWTFIIHAVADSGSNAADGFMGFVMGVPLAALVITTGWVICKAL